MSERYPVKPFVLERFSLEYNLPGTRQSTPPGYASFAQNVVAYPGRVTTRPGMTTVATLANDPVSFREFISQDLATRYGIALLNDAALMRDSGTYAFGTTISAAGLLVESSLAAGMRMNAVTAFGREWMGFGTNGLVPLTLPFAYDGTNLDRAAFPGPGGAPTVAASVTAGTVAAGVRKFRVFYTSKYGHISPPGPSGTYTAADSTHATDVSAIPLGPSWVTGRIVGATVADDDDYYYVPASAMVITNNTTTTINALTFTDAELLAGVALMTAAASSDNLNRQIALPAQVWNAFYSGRLVWGGERSHYVLNGDVGPRNLEFNGGFATNLPLGWTEKVAGEAKGSGVTGAVGDWLQITGNGSQRGCLQNNSVLTDFIDAGKALKARLRLRKSAALTSGTLEVYLANSGDAANTPAGGFSIAMSTVSSTEWKWFEGTIATFSGYTNDSRIRISGGDAAGVGGAVLTNTGVLHIDQIELFAAERTHQPSLARWSKANKPDSYHGQTGFQYVAQDNGQRLVTGFSLKGSFYYVKEHSLHVTRDDGVREPADWPVHVVSSTVGTPSAKGVGFGDQWVAIADRSGLYYFDGVTAPAPLSNHVQQTWDRINWLYGHTIRCTVDTTRRMIWVACPLDSATTATSILCFQWYGGSPTAQPMEENRWYEATGNASYNEITFSERSDGTRHALFATSGLTGKLARLDESVRTDFGSSTISSTYRSSFIGRSGFESGFNRMTLALSGSGSPQLTLLGRTGATYFSNTTTVLEASPLTDVNYDVTRARNERLCLSIASVASGDWWQLERAAFFVENPPILAVRGERR